MHTWMLISETSFTWLGYAELPWYGDLLIALWIWCLGANVGSFINVVVYRLPARKSVVLPRSRCPACGYSIAWYDNIPMLSWMLLRARCRRCGVKISSRYPTVEAAIAIMFLGVAFLSPITSGANLPELQIVPPARFQSMLTLWLMYGLHMLLLSTLAAAALIRYDQHRPPVGLYLPVLTVGIIGPLIWPELRPVPLAAPLELAAISIAALDAFSGLAVGATLALVGRSPGHGPRAWLIPDIAAGGCVGLVLGWQAACLLVPSAALAQLLTLRLATQWRFFRRWAWTGHLWWATIVYIACWRWLLERSAGLGSQATVATFALAAAVVAILAWLASGIRAAEVLPASSTFPTRTEPRNPTMDRPETPDVQRILDSPSYRLAEQDTDFLARDALRPVRLQLELLKPEMALAEQDVRSTIVAFGGTQIVERSEAEYRLEAARRALLETPEDKAMQRAVRRAERVLEKSHYYDAAREFGRIVSSTCQHDGRCDFVIITGGGPGIMEAANRGAYDVGAKSAGLNITLPEEQAPNPYITPELCFQFHYFALRKMHFLFRAKALVVFPGGFGTLDELFDALTLRQTRRMQEIPIILYGRQYWNRVINFEFLADEGVIRDDHLELIQYAETPQEAWQIITRFYDVT